MGFNWAMAGAGLLGGISDEAKAIQQRQQELENRKLEQDALDRREQALLARQEALQKFGYELTAEDNKQRELTRQQERGEDKEQHKTEFDAKMDLERKQLEISNAMKNRPEKASDFEQKSSAIEKAVATGKISEEEGKARMDALYGLRGKGEMTEAQALRLSMQEADVKRQQSEQTRKNELKLDEILYLSGGKITEENLNKVNAQQKAMGRPMAEKVQVGEKKDHMWSDKKPVYEYQLPVVDEMPQEKGILGGASATKQVPEEQKGIIGQQKAEQYPEDQKKTDAMRWLESKSDKIVTKNSSPEKPQKSEAEMALDEVRAAREANTGDNRLVSTDGAKELGSAIKNTAVGSVEAAKSQGKTAYDIYQSVIGKPFSDKVNQALTAVQKDAAITKLKQQAKMGIITDDEFIQAYNLLQ